MEHQKNIEAAKAAFYMEIDMFLPGCDLLYVLVNGIMKVIQISLSFTFICT